MGSDPAPLPKQGRGRQRKDDRTVLNGIFNILRTGAPWRDLPDRFGRRTVVYNHYVRRGEHGVRQRIFDTRPPNVRSNWSSLIVRSSKRTGRQQAQKGELAQGIGRSRGGCGRKIHVAVDHVGRPLRIEITGAQTRYRKAFGAFIGWQKQPTAIIAEKAYGSKAIRQAISHEGALAGIPSKPNTRVHIPHDPDIYAQQNLVERFFCRMKDMRKLTI